LSCAKCVVSIEKMPLGVKPSCAQTGGCALAVDSCEQTSANAFVRCPRRGPSPSRDRQFEAAVM
jgi:hypothetical protein